jgi:hypothetical protein
MSAKFTLIVRFKLEETARVYLHLPSEQEQATAKANTGVLRCAQNDKTELTCWLLRFTL